MKEDSKLAFLKGLDSKMDWNLDKIKKSKSSKALQSASSPSRKLTKSQKRTAKRNLAFALAQESIQKKKVETIVFDNPDATWKKTGGKRRSTRLSQQNSSAEGIDIDMKKTRFEIMKFGMTGMSSDEKADAETALAISLGAKPDKSAYLNYKELQEKRKKEKEEKEAREAAMIKPKIKPTKTKTSKKAKGSKKLSANNVIVKVNKSGAASSGGGGGATGGGRKAFSGKRPDKRNREAKRKR